MLTPVVDPAALPDAVYEAFRASVSRWPRNPFLHIPASACSTYAEGPLEYSYEQAFSEIEALRECYRDAGFGAGMRVALLLENRPGFFFHWFALNALGVSVVPLNPEYRASEMGFLLAHSESVAAIALSERVAAVKAAAEAGGVSIPVFDESRVRQGLPRIAERIDSRAIVGRDAECGLLYTSGTTGKPKGCILSNDYYLRAGAR